MKKSLLIFLGVLFLVFGTSKTTHAIEYTDSSPSMKIKYDTGARNSIRKLEFGLASKQLSLRQITHLKMIHSNWARKNAVEYWLNPTFLNMAAAPFSEALSQYKSPELVTTGLSAGIAGLQNVRSIGSAAKGVARSLDDLSSLRGATWKEAKNLISKGWTRDSMNKGEGIKFVNPNKKGEQILLERGWSGAKDPLHAEPSRNGKVTKIPLQETLF